MEGQADIFDLLEMVTVHCFFARWCSHTVHNTDPDEASREMEEHYAAKHYGVHLDIINREVNAGGKT